VISCSRSSPRVSLLACVLDHPDEKPHPKNELNMSDMSSPANHAPQKPEALHPVLP